MNMQQFMRRFADNSNTNFTSTREYARDNKSITYTQLRDRLVAYWNETLSLEQRKTYYGEACAVFTTFTHENNPFLTLVNTDTVKTGLTQEAIDAFRKEAGINVVRRNPGNAFLTGFITLVGGFSAAVLGMGLFEVIAGTSVLPAFAFIPFLAALGPVSAFFVVAALIAGAAFAGYALVTSFTAATTGKSVGVYDDSTDDPRPAAPVIATPTGSSNGLTMFGPAAAITATATAVDAATATPPGG